MSDRWDRQQVLGLAPDQASAKAAGPVARPGRWAAAGCDAEAVWGECLGSGRSAAGSRQGGGENTRAYKACVDLSEPAFRCSCPSRKFPCKHALALLLLWSDGAVDGGPRPGWVMEWIVERQRRAELAERRRAETAAAGDGAGGAAKTPDPKTAERREQRVEGGLADLDRWLRDQVEHGLANADKASYGLWDGMARRMVDAQASALAGQLRGLAAIPRRGDDWPQRLLAEYALLRLLTRAHARRAHLPGPLGETVRSRVGFTTPQEEVLSRGERVADQWYVVGIRDNEQERLITRRVWLRGGRTGRAALVLSFAAPGRTFDVSLVPGSTIDAELAFYPGAQPLRALVAERHGAAETAEPPGTAIAALRDEYAAALARNPWLERWPATLAGVRPAIRSGVRDGGLHLLDAAGDAVPLRTADPWPLLAVSGGRPFTVAGEWSHRGLRPLSAWQPDEGIVIL